MSIFTVVKNLKALTTADITHSAVTAGVGLTNVPNAVPDTLPEGVPMDWDKVFDRLITLIAVAQPITYFLLKEVGIVDHETTSVTEVEAWLKTGRPVNAVDGDNVLHRFIPDFERGVLNYRTTFKTEVVK